MTDNARIVRDALERWLPSNRREAITALTALETELATTRAREAELTKALAEVQADLERAREALDSIRIYGSDTLSGPMDAPDNREYYREGVKVMTRRARAALAPEQKGERAMSGHKTEEEAIAAAKAAVYGFTDFNGQNCENPCAGWDGDSPRCECGNRRVDWATGRNDDGTFYAYAEAY